MQLQQVLEDQAFSPTLIAGALRTTKAEIAGTLGLSRDALSRSTRIRARKTQTRLREMVEILRGIISKSARGASGTLPLGISPACS